LAFLIFNVQSVVVVPDADLTRFFSRTWVTWAGGGRDSGNSKKDTRHLRSPHCTHRERKQKKSRKKKAKKRLTAQPIY